MTRRAAALTPRVSFEAPTSQPNTAGVADVVSVLDVQPRALLIEQRQQDQHRGARHPKATELGAGQQRGPHRARKR
eukprot:CAMPEP_0176145774 /NCGR_PEP_ID=MMETSP0120_2-20121206/74267_1 /TAXON_ID=160619 /ORGANISM="Kryptoperidinium foliaceum, Strain CCMP 1326" /LENGTH=75 /DNA_ID=CAMNT_0017482267 /DNA_START=33 /DNA_END=258 /DNA_ORIENTATION=-